MFKIFIEQQQNMYCIYQ